MTRSFLPTILSMASVRQFPTQPASPPPRTSGKGITSTFALLRGGRKRSSDAKTLSNSRSFESFNSLNKPVDTRSLPPVPRLPSTTFSLHSRAASCTFYSYSFHCLCYLASAQSSATLTSSPPWDSTSNPTTPRNVPEFPNPVYYDEKLQAVPQRQSSLVNAPRLVPLRLNTDEEDQKVVSQRSASPEPLQSPMERTLDQRLERHGADLVNSANLFDRQMLESVVLADSLRGANHDRAKAVAKLGKSFRLCTNV